MKHLTVFQEGTKVGTVDAPGYFDNPRSAAKKSHARLSPSKAHRWLVCPGSMHVTAEDPETEWAAEGTRKHAVLERVLSPKASPLIAGDTLETPAGPYKVPLEVLEQCHEIRGFIEQFKSTHEAGWVVETEVPVEIGSHVWPMAPGECSGTTDAAAYSCDELLVLDAKFGFVHVEARGNPQLMLYALGLLGELPFAIRWVTLCIAQPGYDGLVVFREHRLQADELRAWALDQQAVIDEIRAGSRRLQADDHACRYCPARAQCPARLQALEEASQAEWMTSRSLEELLPYVPRLRAICKDIEQRAMVDLGGGKPVRGWKLVAAESKRRWREDDGEVEGKMLQALGGIAYGFEAYNRKLKSPAQMEKALRAAKASMNEKMPPKEAKAIVDEHAFKPAGGPRLVPESDPRPALEAATWTAEDVLRASLEAGDDETT